MKPTKIIFWILVAFLVMIGMVTLIALLQMQTMWNGGVCNIGGNC